jgi:hypothetical protein
VSVTARERIRASTEAEADDVLNNLDLVIEQAGSDITATARYDSRPLGWHFGEWPPVQVDFTVTVPAGFATDLKTSGGRIEVGDLAGKVDARTSGGSIKLGKMGAEVDARTSGGSITLDEAGGSVTLRTSGGTITVGRVGGTADLNTSGGSIRIEAVEGSVRAHTSGGSIRAAIRGPLKDDCSLSTSGGSVTAVVDKSAAFRLDAASSGGGVDAAGLTLTVERGSSRGRLTGTVNGGGPLLKLRSSGGGVAVRTQ